LENWLALRAGGWPVGLFCRARVQGCVVGVLMAYVIRHMADQDLDFATRTVQDVDWELVGRIDTGSIKQVLGCGQCFVFVRLGGRGWLR
jgi:hypothetical protein